MGVNICRTRRRMVSQEFVKVASMGDLKPGEMKLVRMAS
jgi:hypothetical protein